MNALYRLFAGNRGRGLPMAAAIDGDRLTLDVYDVIVASEADAAWLGGVSAETFVKAVRAFPGAAVDVRVSSPGGDVFAGVAMAEALRQTPARVTVHVEGLAASAASLLVAAADEAVIAPGAMVMIHNAWTIALGDRNDFLKEAAVLEKIDGEIARAYRDKAGGEDDDWRARMDAETWFTADEAVAIGLVDRVSERAAKAQAFDLSAFRNAPAAAADVPQWPGLADLGEAIAAQAADFERRRRRDRLDLAMRLSGASAR